jgi:hypothetical protein
VRAGGRIESGVLGCECCAFPIIAGIPVMLADDRTRRARARSRTPRRRALHAAARGRARRRVPALLARGALATTAMRSRSQRGRRGHEFLYRLSDPTPDGRGAHAGAFATALDPGGPRARLCGGTGHLTRASGLRPSATRWCLPMSSSGAVAAGFTFRVRAVCCDADHPMPFTRHVPTVVLSDAFPTSGAAAAEEMMRLAARRRGGHRTCTARSARTCRRG